jgi:hypothetical protein
MKLYVLMLKIIKSLSSIQKYVKAPLNIVYIVYSSSLKSIMPTSRNAKFRGIRSIPDHNVIYKYTHVYNMVDQV